MPSICTFALKVFAPCFKSIASEIERPIDSVFSSVVDEFPRILNVTFAVVFEEKKYTVLFKTSILTFPPTAVVKIFAVSNALTIEIDKANKKIETLKD